MLENLQDIDLYTCKYLIWKNEIDNFTDAQTFARNYFKGCPETYTNSQIDAATTDDNTDFLNWLISDLETHRTMNADLKTDVQSKLGG